MPLSLNNTLIKTTGQSISGQSAHFAIDCFDSKGIALYVNKLRGLKIPVNCDNFLSRLVSQALLPRTCVGSRLNTTPAREIKPAPVYGDFQLPAPARSLVHISAKLMTLPRGFGFACVLARGEKICVNHLS
jgi:hypothetical protein